MRKNKNLQERISDISRIKMIGVLLIIIAILIAIFGTVNQYGQVYLGEFMGGLIRDFYAALSVALAATGIIASSSAWRPNSACRLPG